MNRSELMFERPGTLEASAPPEFRGLERDEVKLMVSVPWGHLHAQFRDLAGFLGPGDLLVVNNSATVPASLPAEGPGGPFLLNLSTDFGRGLWLAEPRWSYSVPGSLPLGPGDRVRIADQASVRMVTPYPGLPRLWFIQADDDLRTTMGRVGRPIRYGYSAHEYPMGMYQTIFASVPGSAEMPSAARPFSPRVLHGLRARGVGIAEITLHPGVSSLEVEVDRVEAQPLPPEPFVVPPATARVINATRAHGGRVIAVGTTVVRALESAWDGRGVRAASGFSRVYVHPGSGTHAFDGLLTGLHDPATSHLALLYAVAGPDAIRSAYATAVDHGYLWHEFGDSHLILPGPTVPRKGRRF